MGSESRARSNGTTAMRSRWGTARYARLSTRPASNIYIKPRMPARLTGSLKQPVANRDPEAMISGQGANNDACSRRIQLPQSCKQATGQFYLILQIPPFKDKIAFAGKGRRQHHADRLACRLQFCGETG